MHGQRLALAVRSEVVNELLENGRRLYLALERHGEHPRRLVDDDERVVFEDDTQVAGSRGRSTARAPGSIHPDADAIAGRQLHGSCARGNLDRVDEYPSSIERDRCAASGAETFLLGEKLIEPQALFGGRDDPFHLLEFSPGCSSSDASSRRFSWPSRLRTCSRQFTGFLRRSNSPARHSGTRTRT